MDFAGKRVLVTGSTRGIGRAAAELFLERGAGVAINGRSAASVEQTLAEMRAVNLDQAGALIPTPGDIGTVAGCEATVAAAIDGLGGLDILVNSAGIFSTAPLEECDEARWDEMMNINLKGTFFCTRAAISALRDGGGAVVNLASDAALLGYQDMSIYCASKGGVAALTRAFALEFAPAVRVNCVCPAWVETDMAKDLIDAAEDPIAARAEVDAMVPMMRIASPLEIGKAIAYLASEDAGFITGISLPLDGGETAGR